MALIVPFQGILYNQKKVGDIRRVIAPPYDVISPEAQNSFYRRHPQNVIRLILNKETPEDNPQNNRYTRSAAHYRTWLEEGTLVRSRAPQFYFLQEEFDASLSLPTDGGLPATRKVRRGFIGLIRLEEFGTGVVLPHEKTQTKPKADRLALMEACQANFSQIFSLYSDEDGAMAPIYEKVFSSPEGPAIDVTDDDGIRHRLWMVSDPQIIGKITEIMKPKKKSTLQTDITAMKPLWPTESDSLPAFPTARGRESYHFTMMYLAAMEDEGLLILSTHRVVVGVEKFQASSFMEKT